MVSLHLDCYLCATYVVGHLLRSLLMSLSSSSDQRPAREDELRREPSDRCDVDESAEWLRLRDARTRCPRSCPPADAESTEPDLDLPLPTLAVDRRDRLEVSWLEVLAPVAAADVPAGTAWV